MAIPYPSALIFVQDIVQIAEPMAAVVRHRLDQRLSAGEAAGQRLTPLEVVLQLAACGDRA